MPDTEFDPAPLLETLVRHEVDFVLIGGLAAAALGSSRSTYDIDVAYGRTTENLERLTSALTELGATLRGAPAGVPFLLNAKTLASGLNFTLSTRFGRWTSSVSPRARQGMRTSRARLSQLPSEGSRCAWHRSTT